MMVAPFITVIRSGRGVGPDLSVKMAITTSMATIVFTSFFSVCAHHQRVLVRWDLVKSLAPGIILGDAMVSLRVFALLKGARLALFFAAFVIFSVTQMFFNKKLVPTRLVPSAGGFVVAGGVIGFLSGMVGASGGFVSLPSMAVLNTSPLEAGIFILHIIRATGP